MSRARPADSGAWGRPGLSDALCAVHSHRCAEPRRRGRWTALHIAAYNGNADAMCELIAAGAVVGLKNNRGYALALWRAFREAAHWPWRRAA